MGENLKAEGENPLKKEIDYNNPLVIVNFSIDRQHLGIVENDGKKIMEIDSKNFTSTLLEYPSKVIMKFNLESLEIEDNTFTYVNPNLQKFLTSIHPDSQDSNNLVEIMITILDKEHPDWKQKKTALGIVAKFGCLFLNYKPQVVEWLIIFFFPARPEVSNIVGHQNDPSNEEDKGNMTIYKKMMIFQGILKEETLYDDPHTNRVNIQIESQQVTLRLIHRQTYVLLYQITLKDLAIVVILKPDIIEVNGKLGHVQLYEMSGYPYTEDSNINYKLIIPNEIVGLGKNEGNSVDFSFITTASHSDLADKKSRIFTRLLLNFYNTKFNYMNQPVERFVNYLDEQILFLTSINLVEAGASFKPIKLTNKICEFILNQPEFFYLGVYIKEPIAILKALPTSKDYIEINVKDVVLTTHNIKNTTRFKNPSKPLDFVYATNYIIKINDIAINKVVGGVKTRISNTFYFELEFERLLHYDVYNFLYGGPDTSFQLSKAFLLKGKFSPVILMMSRADYLLLMRGIFFNVTYDDMMDMLYVYSFNVSSQRLPSKIIYRFNHCNFLI